MLYPVLFKGVFIRDCVISQMLLCKDALQTMKQTQHILYTQLWNFITHTSTANNETREIPINREQTPANNA